MTMRLISTFCFLLILGTYAFADQCYWLLSPEQASKAFEFMRPNETVYAYCAPCKDKIARPIAVKTSYIVKDAECRYSGLTVNGTGIDLAYTYVPVDGKYKNLAKLVGCPCEGVPLILPKEKLPR